MNTSLCLTPCDGPRNRQLLVAGLLAVVFLSLAACSTADRSARSAPLSRTPAPAVVAHDALWRAALAESDRRPGSFVVVIDNDEMMPMYPRGTALVVERVDFHDLQPGMTALMQRADGGCTSHVLALSLPDGWVTRALNSKDDDAVLMTESRYVGKVAAAFTATLSATASN